MPPLVVVMMEFLIDFSITLFEAVLLAACISNEIIVSLMGWIV